jgi:hypothetical protein
MGSKNNLSELIKSLNKSEIRYFKLTSSIQHGDKNYLKLFDEMLKQNNITYDEKMIKEKFKNEKFTNQLTFTKNYLYSGILKSLVLYSGEISVDMKIHSMINKARILYNKALFGQYFHMLKKAKETCLKYERFSSYLQLLEMEKVIIIKKISPDTGSSIDEAKLYDEEINILNKLRNLAEYQNLVSRLTGLFRMKGRAREDSVLKLISVMKESHVMMSPHRADSIIALERYYFIHQLTADLLGDFKTMHKYARKRYELIIENPFPFRDQMFNYRQDILLYMILLGSRVRVEPDTGLSLQEKQKKYLDMLKEHTGNTDIEKINLFLIESTLKLSNTANFPDFETALAEINNIVEGLSKYRGKLDSNYEILIYNSIVKICVYFGEYAKANIYLNILLNLPQLSIRKDIELYARILNLVVHFELGNFELLEYLIRSTYRYLISMNNVYGFERAVINFLRKLTSISTNDQLLENLELLKNEMDELKKDPLEKNAMLYFDFPLWIDKKILALRKTN